MARANNVKRPDMKRRSIWLWFALAWLVLGVLYGYPMRASVSGAITPWQGIARGLTHVAPVALAAGVIWWFTGVVTWPPRRRWRFFVVHVLAAAVYGFVWLAIDTSIIAYSTGYTVAFEIVRVFAG